MPPSPRSALSQLSRAAGQPKFTAFKPGPIDSRDGLPILDESNPTFRAAFPNIVAQTAGKTGLGRPAPAYTPAESEQASNTYFGLPGATPAPAKPTYGVPRAGEAFKRVGRDSYIRVPAGPGTFASIEEARNSDWRRDPDPTVARQVPAAARAAVPSTATQAATPGSATEAARQVPAAARAAVPSTATQAATPGSATEAAPTEPLKSSAYPRPPPAMPPSASALATSAYPRQTADTPGSGAVQPGSVPRYSGPMARPTPDYSGPMAWSEPPPLQYSRAVQPDVAATKDTALAALSGRRPGKHAWSGKLPVDVEPSTPPSLLERGTSALQRLFAPTAPPPAIKKWYPEAIARAEHDYRRQLGIVPPPRAQAALKPEYATPAAILGRAENAARLVNLSSDRQERALFGGVRSNVEDAARKERVRLATPPAAMPGSALEALAPPPGSPMYDLMRRIRRTGSGTSAPGAPDTGIRNGGPEAVPYVPVPKLAPPDPYPDTVAAPLPRQDALALRKRQVVPRRVSQFVDYTAPTPRAPAAGTGGTPAFAPMLPSTPVPNGGMPSNGLTLAPGHTNEQLMSDANASRRDYEALDKARRSSPPDPYPDTVAAPLPRQDALALRKRQVVPRRVSQFVDYTAPTPRAPAAGTGGTPAFAPMLPSTPVPNGGMPSNGLTLAPGHTNEQLMSDANASRRDYEALDKARRSSPPANASPASTKGPAPMKKESADKLNRLGAQLKSAQSAGEATGYLKQLPGPVAAADPTTPDKPWLPAALGGVGGPELSMADKLRGNAESALRNATPAGMAGVGAVAGAGFNALRTAVGNIRRKRKGEPTKSVIGGALTGGLIGGGLGAGAGYAMKQAEAVEHLNKLGAHLRTANR